MKRKVTLLIASAALTAFASPGYSEDANTTNNNTLAPTAATSVPAKPSHHVRHKRHHPKKVMPATHAPHQELNEGSAPVVSVNSQGTSAETTPIGQWFLTHFSGNFDFTSNYMFRGVSQSSDLPAVQGGITYTSDLGIYFNLWGSNVNFFNPQGQTATVEFDYILGVTNKVGDNFSYDINIDRYNYPKAPGSNYSEIIGNFVYYFLTFQLGYSSNVFGSHGDGTYTNVGFNFPVLQRLVYFNNVTFSGGIGHYSLPTQAGNSYYDYNLALTKKLDKYTFQLQWTDTNGAYNYHPYDNAKILATISVAF